MPSWRAAVRNALQPAAMLTLLVAVMLMHGALAHVDDGCGDDSTTLQSTSPATVTLNAVQSASMTNIAQGSTNSGSDDGCWCNPICWAALSADPRLNAGLLLVLAFLALLALWGLLGTPRRPPPWLRATARERPPPRTAGVALLTTLCVART